jgi:ABC-type antimicrobial peptide transport system permease subunit
MIKNLIKIAFRNLWKNKAYSAINIGGLALGMAVTLTIVLWIMDELEVNTQYENHDQIAQMYMSQTINGEIFTMNSMPRPLEFTLREKHGDLFEHIVMSSWNFPGNFQYRETNMVINGNQMQKGIIDMLDIMVTAGNQNGWEHDNSIMLSKSAAQSLFGDEAPIGKTIKLSNAHPLEVTAIYADLPENSRFDQLNYIIPWNFFVNTNEWVKNSEEYWDNNSFQMFVQMSDHVAFANAEDLIKDAKIIANPESEPFNPQLVLHKMSDWHLRGWYENGVQTGGRIENVWLFGIIGLFVLMLACINFINLSTARSEKRAMEVGIRKSIGSSRGQLIRQFFGESFLVVLIAYVLSILLVVISLGFFNDLASKNIQMPFGNPYFWLVSAALIAVTVVLAGSYPALYLSGFKPIRVLKGSLSDGKKSTLPRKMLVVTQFSVSIALIVCTLVVVKQINYSKDRPAGYSKAGLIQIPTFSGEFDGKYELMRDRFLKSGAVTDFASSSSPVTEVWSNRSGYEWQGKDSDFTPDLAHTQVSFDYMQTMDMKIIEGRDFSRDFASDSTGVILNKTAVKYMGLENPIGMKITTDDPDDEGWFMTVIGVVEDAIVQNPFEPVKQHMYVYDTDNNSSFYTLRLNPDRSVSDALATVESIFKESFPNVPYSYEFVDENYARKFSDQEQFASIAKVFTILAIIISCLGLFGLASFVAEQRTKEIGIRKVLGASVANLWLLLSKDFLLLVGISILIATPIAYYFMSDWIERFSYRANIGATVFILAGIGAIVLTIITVSFQAIKAAVANPVNSLKTE